MKNAIPMFAALVVLGLFGATLVAAYQNGMIGGMTDGERGAIQTAIENNDYGAWKTAVESTLTEERFNEMQARRAEMDERRAAIDAAFEARDYGAWVEAMSENDNGRGNRMAEFVTEENFSLFAEMHEAMQSGDFEKAEEIRAELGLPEGPSGCMGGGVRFGKGMGMHKVAW